MKGEDKRSETRSAQKEGVGGRGEILQRDTHSLVLLFSVGRDQEEWDPTLSVGTSVTELMGLTAEWGNSAEDGLCLGPDGRAPLADQAGRWRQSARANYSHAAEIVAWGEVEPEPGAVGRLPTHHEEGEGVAGQAGRHSGMQCQTLTEGELSRRGDQPQELQAKLLGLAT